VSDNRITADGVTRILEYDGSTGQATFFLGDDTVTALLPFSTAHKIAEALKQAHREGYRAGVSTALQVLKNFERSC
jgi:hypothetical protein